jgi:hypothetical protein
VCSTQLIEGIELPNQLVGGDLRRIVEGLVGQGEEELLNISSSPLNSTNFNPTKVNYKEKGIDILVCKIAGFKNRINTILFS